MQNLSTVRNVLFDLGGVILNIDYQLTSKAFRQMGFNNFDELYSKARQSGLFDRFETGRMKGEEFVAEINRLSQQNLPEQEIVQAWNAMLLDFPEQRLKLLEKLQQKYRLFLLSNTNEIHQQAFEKILFSTCGQKSLDPWFEKVYFSHHINLRKPDAEVFRFVLDQNGLLPEETLFIDDSRQHIEGAKLTGLQAVWLNHEPVEEVISRLL